MKPRVSHFAALASVLGLLVGLGLISPQSPQATAQPRADAALPADLAAVPVDALGFVHVRVAEVWKHEAMKEYRKIIEKAGPQALAALDEQFIPAPSTLDRVTVVILPPEGDRPEPQVAVILAFKAPFDAVKLRSAYLPEAKRHRVGPKEYFADERNQLAVHFPDERTLAFGEEKAMQRLLARPIRPEGGLSDALRQAAAGKAIFASMNVKKLPLPPGLTDQVPEDLQPLLKTENVILSIDLQQEAVVQARLAYATEADATAAERALKKAAEMGRGALATYRRQAEQTLFKREQKTPRPLEELPDALGAVAALGALNTLDEILADPPLKRDGNVLTATVTLPAWTTQYVALSAVATGLTLPAIQKVREAAARTQSSNNLKQIGLALHGYADTNNGLPPAAIVDRKGKRLLSWRVSILPYLEQQALYQQFKLDEPWDSEHNKKLIPLMPKVYADPRAPLEPGKTYYKVFVGETAGFDWIKPRQFPTDFPDGTSNTIAVIAAGDPVIWTKPDDIDFDPEKPLADFSKPFRTILVTLFDGSVRALNPQISETTFKRAIMRNDGHVLGNDF